MVDALGAYWRIARTAFRESYSTMTPLTYTLFLLVRPVSQVVFFGLAAWFATGRSDVSFQLIGNAVQVCALSSLFTVSDVMTYERGNGTLALVTLAARNRFMVFGGRLLVVGMHGLLTSAIALAIGATIFRLDAGHIQWLGLIASFVVTVVATSSLGVALGSVGLVLRDLNLVGNFLVVGMMAICGIQFPVAALPGWLRTIAYALPMTRGATAARLAFAGGGPGMAGLLLGELLVGLVWLAVGFGLYAYLERQARVYGTLELY